MYTSRVARFSLLHTVCYYPRLLITVTLYAENGVLFYTVTYKNNIKNKVISGIRNTSASPWIKLRMYANGVIC